MPAGRKLLSDGFLFLQCPVGMDMPLPQHTHVCGEKHAAIRTKANIQCVEPWRGGPDGIKCLGATVFACVVKPDNPIVPCAYPIAMMQSVFQHLYGVISVPGYAVETRFEAVVPEQASSCLKNP